MLITDIENVTFGDIMSWSVLSLGQMPIGWGIGIAGFDCLKAWARYCDVALLSHCPIDPYPHRDITRMCDEVLQVWGQKSAS